MAKFLGVTKVVRINKELDRKIKAILLADKSNVFENNESMVIRAAINYFYAHRLQEGYLK